MSDLIKILAETQKEMLKLKAPVVKKPTIHQNLEDSDSETENKHPASTLTPIKSKATTFKITPISSRNKMNQNFLFVEFLCIFSVHWLFLSLEFMSL